MARERVRPVPTVSLPPDHPDNGRASAKSAARTTSPKPTPAEPTVVVESDVPTLIQRSPDGANGWDGTTWRPIADFGPSPDAGAGDDDTGTSSDVAPGPEPDSSDASDVVTDVPVDEIPPAVAPRPRGRPRGSTNRASAATPAASVVQDLSVPADPNAPFSPRIVALHVTAKRTVSTGKYESFEVQAHAQAIPDPRHSVVDNLSLLTGLVRQQVNEVAENVAREVQIDR